LFLCFSDGIFTGQFDRAIADLEIVLEGSPKHKLQALLERGQCYHFKKEYDLALKDYDSAIELNEKEADAFFFRGRSLPSSPSASFSLPSFCLLGRRTKI
jgi:tetratricopeptide (TPR) repeat protein